MPYPSKFKTSKKLLEGLNVKAEVLMVHLSLRFIESLYFLPTSKMLPLLKVVFYLNSISAF